MADAKERLTRIGVREVSLVDSGDDPGARTVLFKRRDKASLAERVRKAFSTLLKAAPDLDIEDDELAEIKKLSFNEIQGERKKSSAYDVIDGRACFALMSAIWDALYLDANAGREEEAIRESVMQFAESIDEDVAGILAGNILKRSHGSATGTGVYQQSGARLFKVVREEFAKQRDSEGTPQGDNGGAGTEPELAHTEDEAMPKTVDLSKLDLSKLDDKTREAVEGAIARAGEADTLEGQLAKLAGGNGNGDEGGEGAGDEGGAGSGGEGGGEGEGTDIAKAIAALPENVRSLFKSIGVEKSAMAKRILVLEKREARSTFAKSLNLGNLPGDHEAIIDDLMEAPESVRKSIAGILGQASEAMTRSGVTRELGSGHGGEAGGSGSDSAAFAKLHANAVEIRKSRPELTQEQAFTEAMDENPALYDEYLAEEAEGARQ